MKYSESVDDTNNDLEIAIIGMAGRFPGAQNIGEFWQNLQNGVESVSFFTEQELENSGIDTAQMRDPSYVKAKPILKDIELFDACFFNYSPKEAEFTDPQQRLFLECALEALEVSGYGSDHNSIGVYAGSTTSSYQFNLYLNPDVVALGDMISIGNDNDSLSTRISYQLNLKGPSINIQTYCSTSLVAVHTACQSLLNYECDIALAGGVSIQVPQKAGYNYQQEGMLSPDGRCRAFDAKAQGSPFGNGLGIVVLKRLEEAIADGDTVHAVIKGSAINNDGSLKASYTAPSVDGQANVIVEALSSAEVEPDTITYLEAHGTGTPIGDPIEIAALTQAFRTQTQKKGFCAIGSVKTNIGHLDRAAGVSGLIKAILALKHKQIPPSLHFEQPNPHIDFDNSPFYVNTKLSPWETNGTPRRAGVSSFGVGGTNAHVIVEEAPPTQPSSSSRPWQLLLLSAKTESALETATTNLVTHLKQHPDLNLADVAYTLQVGRRTFDHRRMLLCQNCDDAVTVLENLDPQRTFTHFQEPINRQVTFMFPGQGSQYVNMGKELYDTELIFRKHIDDCCEILKSHIDVDLRTILYPNQEKTEFATQQLQHIQITQPALFVIEYALAKLWMSWGIFPVAMIGHSIGEYVAATLAGVFSLEDALRIVAMRGKLMQQLPSSAMLSIQLPEEEVEQLLEGEISLAASNAPTNCVVSGSTEAIDKLQQELQQIGISCRRLHTSHAFYSQMMEPIIDTFIQLLCKVKLNPPKISFVSNVSGTWITAAQATDPNYWAKHLRQPIRFCQGIAQLAKTPETLFLEVGPGRALSTFVKQHQKEESLVLTSIRHHQEQQSDVAFLLSNLGKLWLVGVDVKWSGFYASERRHRIPLPTYPFERQPYWIELNRQVQDDHQTSASPAKKTNIADWFYIPCWRQSTSLQLFQKEKSLEQQSRWLVFVDTYGLGSEFAETLKQQGQDVIVVRIADNFAKLNDSTYAINPQERDDYDALLQVLGEQNWTPQGITHFWSVAPNETLPKLKLDEQVQLQSRYQFFEDCQSLGFYSLLFLTQSLAKQNVTNSIKLMVVTSNIHDVTGGENLCPEKSTILGPCKVIPQEYPNITCCCFDVVLPELGTQLSSKLIDSLIGEFAAQPTENIVAYRGHHRWIQTYEPIRLDKNSLGRNKLRKGGVYLITGGLGNVGLLLAEYLAQTVQAKLILLGRKGLPERDRWQEWLINHDEDDSISRKIRKVHSLIALGAEVLAISADVADEQQMHNAIASATQQFGAINGVIHAAGMVEDDYPIIETSKALAQSKFNPKVYGLFVLEKVLQGQELDFCQLTSSLSSILGGLGYTSYCAANIFMDAFTHNYNKTSLFPWSSFNWEDWITEEDQQNADTLSTLYKYGMTSKANSIDAFERLLSMCGFPQVVVSSGDLQARIREWIKLESLKNSELQKGQNLLLKHQRPRLDIAYIAPRNEIEEAVANIWQEILGIEQIGIYDNFFELGGNSLLALQTISHFSKVFGININLRIYLEEPTIFEISQYIENARVTSQKRIVFSSTAVCDSEIEL